MFRSVVMIIYWIQLDHCVDPPCLIEHLELFRVLLDTLKNRVPGLALHISQRKVHAIWPTLWLMGEDVPLHSGKPEKSKHAAYTGKQIRLVNAVQCKQPSQGVAGNPKPARVSGNFLLCRWDNFLGQESQIIVRTTSAGVSIFKNKWTIPRNHIVVSVQIADGYQSKRWATSSLYNFEYLLLFAREGVEIDNRPSYFKTWKNGYRFALG